MKEELLKGLSEEQVAKIKACKNQEEMLAVAKEEGIELTDEQLEAVSGGCGTTTVVAPRPVQKPTCCPACGSANINLVEAKNGNEPGCPTTYYSCSCKKCGHFWAAR